MSDLPVAGWYADPEYPGYLRYWDGQQWSEHRQPDAVSQSAPPDQPPQVPTEPAPDSPTPFEPTVTRTAGGATPGVAPTGPPPAGAWDGSTATGRRQGVSVAVVVTIAVFALLFGVVAGFTIGRLTAGNDGEAAGAGIAGDTLRPGDEVRLAVPRGGASVALQLEGARDVRIEVRSDDFDTTVTLYDDSGVEIAYDDDGLGEDLNSMLDLFLDAGTYQVEVTPFDGSGSGDADIRVR